ncbi:MAG: DUF1080 domain-containing protein [Chthoniobacter sp.]|nr:DUF1080 domain-containing protein [Chthoniobacter sp.]
MNRSPIKLLCLLVVTLLSAFSVARAESPFIGRWALTLPSGSAGWLGIEEKDGQLKGSILWSGGSVLPVEGVKIDGDTLTVTRVAKDVTETITGKVTGDDLALTTVKSKGDGKEFAKADFTGKRIPPVPPAPDLSKVKFGDAITLFNGKDLTGWKMVNPKAESGWSVADGVMMNRIQPGQHLGNLRTEREFEDFNLKLETRTQANSNSGIYLRGIYEIQVAETYGKPVDSHNMGALYSRITPSVAAEKPIGEWQTFDITLVDRHVTVILNGQKIIDNQPVLGCTGGAMTSNEFKPGPIMLQGDHTSIDYRNIVIRPVVK